MALGKYDAERVEGMKTLGDAFNHRDRDREAFIAGVHWALDRINSEQEILGGVPLTQDYVDVVTARLIRSARYGNL